VIHPLKEARESAELVYRDDGHLYEAESSECLYCGIHYTKASFDPGIARLMCEQARQDVLDDPLAPGWLRRAARREAVGVACRPPPA
jgi:hypothetical protein